MIEPKTNLINSSWVRFIYNETGIGVDILG